MNKSTLLTKFNFLFTWGMKVFLVFFTYQLQAQQVVTIPPNNDADKIVSGPLGCRVSYTRTQALYTSAEIGNSGRITEISFYVSSLNTPAASTPVVIRMKNTTDTDVSQSDYPTASTGSTVVYSGNVLSSQLANNSWVTVTLTDPFDYAGLNLELFVETNAGIPDTEPDDGKQFRWSDYVSTDVSQSWLSYGTPPGNTTPGSVNTYRPNVKFTVSPASVMTYISSNVTQSAGITSKETSNQRIASIKIETAGLSSPLAVTDFNLTTNGSTVKTGLIQNARLYYTSVSANFDTTHQFGSISVAPNGSFTISGNQQLAPGINNFWLTYDVGANAASGDILDVECTQIMIDGVLQTPAVTAPSAKTVVGRLYNFDTTTNQGFSVFALGTQPNQWQRGVPTTGPSSAYSGTQCWATNLTGNYSTNPNYGLVTPPYIVQASNISINYKEWYRIVGVNGMRASFQVKVNSGAWGTLNTIFYFAYESNTANKWQDAYFETTANPGDTIQFRWYFNAVSPVVPAQGWYIDNFLVSNVSTFNQTYASSTTSQIGGLTTAGSKKQAVIAVPVNIVGSENPMTLTEMKFNTTGTSSTPGLIENARVYFTGTNDKFDTSTAFGALVNTPSGLFTVTGNQELATGTNYFWLAYDIAATAAPGDVFDAECTEITIASVAHVPTVTAPTGSLPVGKIYTFDAATDEYFTGVPLANKPNEWQRGTPAIGPMAALSGTKCWGTNTTSGYTPNTGYALVSPPYVAQSPVINVRYQQWYRILSAANVTAQFQYKVNNSSTWTTLNTLPATGYEVNSGTRWLPVSVQASVNAGDTVVFRWYFNAGMNAAAAPGWFIDDFVITDAETFNQVYQSAEVAQATGIPAAGKNQPMIRIAVEIAGSDTPLVMNEFTLATTGSVSASLIEKAKVFYTGTRETFDTSTAFGSPVLAPGTMGFTVPGSQSLVTGTNYFWLAYDISNMAQPGDLFNGECTQITIGTNDFTPVATTPLTGLYVGRLYDFDTAGNQFFEAATLNNNPNEWEKGTPANTGPAAAFSGTNCWGTNIDGTYSGSSEYVLLTPAYVTQTANVQVNYKQWYELTAAPDMNASFEFQVNGGGWAALNTLDKSNYTVNSDNKWQDILLQISSTIGDTIRFRWYFSTPSWGSGMAGWYIDNFIVAGVKTFDQVYSKSFVEQIPGIALPGINNQLIRVGVEVTGTDNAVSATGFDFTTNGSHANIIDSAKVYYTGLSNVFETSQPFGTVAITPNGSFQILGSQALVPGTNYFWLTYDLDSSAAPEDTLDATCTSVYVGSNTYTPNDTDPSGNIRVGRLYNFDSAGNDHFETLSLNNNPNQWQRGTPTLVGPSSAYSGNNCWGTNLSGKYGPGSNYVLMTTPYVAQSQIVSVRYKQWYELVLAYNIRAQFQYQVNNSGAWITIANLYAGDDVVNSNGLWEDEFVHALTTPGDTVQFRWSFITDQYATGSSAAAGWYIDDLLIAGVKTMDQAYASSAAITQVEVARPERKNLPVISIPVTISGSENPLQATIFSFSTNGSTPSAGLIAGAKLYYTGLSNTFDTAVQFGNTVTAPSGTFSITGTQGLLAGTNYFWLTYDVGVNAQLHDILDAECSQITISSVARTPVVTAPAGFVMVGRLYDFDTTSNQDFLSVSYNAQPSEWQRGTPLNGPIAAYSGANCWGTNLADVYTTGSEYALVSAPYVAQTSYVNVNYKQWYELVTASSINARFEYQLNNSGTWTSLTALNNVDYEVSSGNKWEDVTLQAPLVAGDTVQFRWYFWVDQWAGTDPGWYIDNFIVSGVALADLFKPTISYTPLTSTYDMTNRNLPAFASIADQSGVDTLAGSKPRIYYKKKSEADIFGFYPAANTASFNGWKYTEATNAVSPFSFGIDYSLLNSPIATADTIEYFVVAQDIYGHPNIAANPDEGFDAYSVNDIITAPTNRLSYIITTSPMSGEYRIGNGEVYTTITAAVNDIGERGVTGAVEFVLTDSIYNNATGETFPLTIREITGASDINTLTIRTAASRDVNITSNNAIFKLDGADYVTIDGADSLTGARNLTLTGTGTTGILWIASKDAVNGATHNTIKNIVFSGSDQTKFAVFSGAGDFTSIFANAIAPNSYNRIENNLILKAQCGIAVLGMSVSNTDLGNVVANNVFGDATHAVSAIGIYMSRQQADTVSGNQVQNLNAALKGLDISGTNYVAGIYLSQCKESFVSRNKVTGWTSNTTAGSSLSGIIIDGKDHAVSNNTVINNFVGNGSAMGSSTFTVNGIHFQNGNGDKVYYNTVHLSGTIINTNGTAAAFYNQQSANIDIRNNIFSVNGTSPAAPHFYAHQTYQAYTGSTLDYNLLTSTGTGAVIAEIGIGRATLASWQSGIAQEAHSKSAAVYFVSASDLHLAGTSIGDSANLAGTPLSYTTDIDGDVRNTAYPYIGADENLSAPLPVKLVSFTASLVKEDVILTWNTASEINNKGFIIERSTDGKTFEHIGFVKGKGNSQSIVKYGSTDANPFTQGVHTIYYRLRQQDVNGKESLSNVVSVSRNDVKQTSLVAFPNPFINDFSILAEANETSDAVVYITDLTGKLVMQASYDLHAGSNLINVDAAKLQSGIYFITLVNGEHKQVIKMIRQ